MPPLQLKYRPKDFKEVLGNESTIKSLESLLRRNKDDIPKAFLFTGPSGCGKTTLARIVANKLGCDDMDFHEYNVASVRGIDTVREVAANAPFAPMSGEIKAYLFDECHGMTKDAKEAMLKLLEDGPKHVYFFLATTEPQQLLKTLKGRCTAYEVQSPTTKSLLGHLKSICAKEGIENYPSEILQEIVKVSDGSIREAVKVLDAVIDIEDDEEALQAVQNAVVSEVDTKELCQALIATSGKRWDTCKKILKGTTDDPERLRRAILGYLNAVLLSNGTERHVEIMELFMEPTFNTGMPGLCVNVFLACKL